MLKEFGKQRSLDEIIIQGAKRTAKLNMAKIIFEGWDIGMKKIQFIKLLINKAGFSLKNAKSLKDKLANDNEIIEIEILDENLAKEILDESQKLKVKCRIRIR